MQTGENHEALRRIFDLLRLGSVLLLLVHLYANCFDLFRSWHLTADVVNNFVYNLTTHISFFRELLQQKMAALILLTVSLLGVKGKKDAELSFRPVLFLIGVGLVLYFLSGVFVRFSYLYAILTCIGFLLILSGGSRLSRIIHIKWDKDIFNDLMKRSRRKNES